MTRSNDGRDRLVALMDALAEHTATLSDREILDDTIAAGVDAKAEAGRVRKGLADALLGAKKQRLQTAAAAHEKTVQALNERVARLPASPESRRGLLDRIVLRQPEMRQTVVTLQHRDFQSFSDADIESALRQLDALGLIDQDLAENE